MGIEPFLCIAVFLIGFVIQVGIALRDRAAERWHEHRWMQQLVDQVGRERGWKMFGDGHWEGTCHGHDVQLYPSTLDPDSARRRVHRATGVRHRNIGRYLQLGVPSTVILVKTGRDRGPWTLRGVGAPRVEAALGDPVLDQLVRAGGDPDADTRAMLARPDVRAPLLELIGHHELSVISADHVAVWIAGHVRDLDAVIELAAEITGAMNTPAQPSQAIAPGLRERADTRRA